MGACASTPATTERELKPWELRGFSSKAEAYLEQTGSLRERERQSLNRVLLTSRVEHDSAASNAGRSHSRNGASQRSGGGGGDGVLDNASVVDSDSVLRSQAGELQRHSLHHSVSGMSGASGRGLHLTPSEVAARRERRRQRLLQEQDEALAMAMAVSASEAEAIAVAMEEPIQADDAAAIAAAQAELDRQASDGENRHSDGEFRRRSSPDGICATIMEAAPDGVAAAEGTAGMEGAAAPLALREKYTTTVAVPQGVREAECAALARIQQHAGSLRQSSVPSPSRRLDLSGSAALGSAQRVADWDQHNNRQRSQQRPQAAKQRDEEEAWRMSSLDSAYDEYSVHSMPVSAAPRRTSKPVAHPPRSFMAA